LARTELHQFQPVALLAKAIHHSKRGQGTRRSTTVSRRLSAELKG